MTNTRQQLHPEYVHMLNTTARDYLARRVSVVPVPGALESGDNAKNPGQCLYTWGKHQHTFANPLEVENWPNFGGLAVVTGYLSNLVAVDIDTPEMQAAFAAACPDLLDTYTEITAVRRLPRYFYIPPYSVKLNTRKLPGIELLANGRVAVVWPTQIDGNSYQVSNPVKPLELSVNQWEQIQAFFNQRQGVEPGQHVAPQIDAPRTSSAADLLMYFEQLIKSLGSRNQALADVGRWAYNSGWTKGDFTALMLDKFVNAPRVTRHKPQSEQSRRAEGIRTINSVFNPKYKHQQANVARSGGFVGGLPNVAREMLLQLSASSSEAPAICEDAKHAARFLDCAYLSGWRAGQAFTNRQGVEMCKPYRMGRNTIESLLDSVVINGHPLFQKIGNFQDTANAMPENGAVAPSPSFVGFEGSANICTQMNSNSRQDNNNVIVSVQMSAKNQKRGRGRPSTAAAKYILPSIEYVCNLLGVDSNKSYPISAADLQSTKAYRSRFTEAFIDRKPGQYSQWLLGKRAGVSRATARRDVVTNPNVQITPMYERQRVTLDNYEYLPGNKKELKETLGWGVWLETGELDPLGAPERFPAIRDAAQSKIRDGLIVELVRQVRSYYNTASAAGNSDVMPMAAGAETTRYEASQMPYRGATKGIEAPSAPAPREYRDRPLTPAEIESDSLFEYGMKSLGAVEITVGVETNE